MDDLVEKLRRRAKQNPTPGGLLVMVDPGTLYDAADEIERLRALKAKVDSGQLSAADPRWQIEFHRTQGWNECLKWLLESSE